jgi:methionyl-tRNA formyltransferase
VNAATLLVVGNDRISRLALEQVRDIPDVVVAVDVSTSAARLVRLIRRGRLSIPLVLRMFGCERRRRSVALTVRHERISSNLELVRLIERISPRRIVLFRAGLIVGPAVLSTGVPVMNIHCARIPEYGGIGSIDRALRDGAYSQCATLHQVTTRIDEGEVHATEPYQLDPADGYCSNEDRAYDAGIRLLKRVLA